MVIFLLIPTIAMCSGESGGERSSYFIQMANGTLDEEKYALYREDESPVILPLKVYLEYIADQSVSEAHLLHDAVHTGIFLSNDSWRYGIITKDGMCYMNILLDEDTMDAAVLSVNILVDREVEGSAEAIARSLWTDLRLAYATLEHYDFMSFYKLFDVGFSHQYFHTYLISTMMEDKVDYYGEDIQKGHYSLDTKSAVGKMGTILEFVEEFFPYISLDELAAFSDPYTLEEAKAFSPPSATDDQILEWQRYVNQHQQVYRFPYQQSLELIVYCKPDTEEIFSIEIHSAEMGYADLLRQYLAFFFQFRDDSYSPEIIDFLLLMDGEEFAWRDVIKTNIYITPIAYLAWNGWGMFIQMDENHIPFAEIVAWDQHTLNYYVKFPF